MPPCLSAYGDLFASVGRYAEQYPISIPTMLKKVFGLAAIAATTELVAAVDTLYVASYAGYIHQLALSGSGDSASLESVGVTGACGVNPAWLELDEETGILYCLNEAYVCWQMIFHSQRSC